MLSSIPLDQLRPEPADAPAARATFTVVVEPGPPPQPDRVVHRWIGRYGLTLAMLDDDWLFTSALDGCFRIDVARTHIRCIVGDPTGTAWRDVFVRRVLPRIAILAGAGALHAAAVATGGGALLLLGESGAGKSTMCAALAMARWDVLSEDVSLLWDAATPQVAPATTGVCLWPDSRRALGLPNARCAPMPGYDGKSRFASGHDTGTAPVALRALVLLARGAGETRPTLHRLSGAEGMMRAAQQRVRFNPADDSGREAIDTFERLRSIVRVTPCYRLTYPADYPALIDVEAALRRLARS